MGNSLPSSLRMWSYCTVAYCRSTKSNHLVISRTTCSKILCFGIFCVPAALTMKQKDVSMLRMRRNRYEDFVQKASSSRSRTRESVDELSQLFVIRMYECSEWLLPAVHLWSPIQSLSLVLMNAPRDCSLQSNSELKFNLSHLYKWMLVVTAHGRTILNSTSVPLICTDEFLTWSLVAVQVRHSTWTLFNR